MAWRWQTEPAVLSRDLPCTPAPLHPCTPSLRSVIWKDGSGTYRCFRDACPHRLVPLSDGRIAPNGELQCPYHGALAARSMY